MPWHCTSLHQSKNCLISSHLISSHLISSLRHHSAPLQAVILPGTCFFTQCLQPLEINPKISDPPTTHGLIEGPLHHAMALHIAAPKQEQSHLISSHIIGTIQHPSKLSSSAHASSPNVCNLWKLIQGSLTSRPPMDYLSTHFPMRWVQRPLE